MRYCLRTVNVLFSLSFAILLILKQLINNRSIVFVNDVFNSLKSVLCYAIFQQLVSICALRDELHVAIVFHIFPIIFLTSCQFFNESFFVWLLKYGGSDFLHMTYLELATSMDTNFELNPDF